MAQIFNIESRLENVGDYAWFIDEDRDVKILAFRYSNSHWAFYGIEGCGFSGSLDPRQSSVLRVYPFLNQYQHSWMVCADKTLEWGIEDLTESNGFDFQIMRNEIPVDFCLVADAVTDEPASETSDVAEFISDKYERLAIYKGFHGYHHHHHTHLNNPAQRYTGYRIGIELEVEFNTRDGRDTFCDIQSNWLYRESDSSLGGYGCEIITIPLLPKDAKDVDFWKPLTDYLKPKAKSWNTGRCGLHVHIGREILGRTDEERSETIGKLLYLYHHFVKDTRMNVKIYGRDRGYHDQDGKTLAGTSAKELGSEVLKIKGVKDKVKSAMIQRSEQDRYFDINLSNEKTIEFRKGRGSINPNRISMVVDYCERMCFYAKSTPWAQIGYDDFVKFLTSTVKNESLKEIIEDYS